MEPLRNGRGREDFRNTNVVVTMLPTGAIVREVLTGANGIAAVLPKGALIIDMSSSEPEGTRALGAMSPWRSRPGRNRSRELVCYRTDTPD